MCFSVSIIYQSISSCIDIHVLRYSLGSLIKTLFTSVLFIAHFILCFVLQVTDLKLSVDLLEKERDFYFSKLRDIEILCQASELENEPVRIPA